MLSQKYERNLEFLKNFDVLTNRNNETLKSNKDLLQKYIKDLTFPIELNTPSPSTKNKILKDNQNLTSNETLKYNNFNIQTDQTMYDNSFDDRVLFNKSKKKSDFLKIDQKELLDETEWEGNNKIEPILFSNINNLIERVKQKHANWALLEGQMDNRFFDNNPTQNNMSAKKPYESGDTQGFLNKLKKRLFKVENADKINEEETDSQPNIIRKAEREIDEVKTLTQKIERSISPKAELKYDKNTDNKEINNKSSKLLPKKSLKNQSTECKSNKNNIEVKNVVETDLDKDSSRSRLNFIKLSKLSEFQITPNKKSQAVPKLNEQFLGNFKQKMAQLKKDYNHVTIQKNEQYKKIAKIKSPLRSTKIPFENTIKTNQKNNLYSENYIVSKYPNSYLLNEQNQTNIPDLKRNNSSQLKNDENNMIPMSSKEDRAPEIRLSVKNLNKQQIFPDQSIRLYGRRNYNIKSPYNMRIDKISELSYSQSNNSLLLTDIRDRELEESKIINIALDFNKLKINNESKANLHWTQEIEEEFKGFCSNDDEINKLKFMIFYHQNQIEKLKFQQH